MRAVSGHIQKHISYLSQAGAFSMVGTLINTEIKLESWPLANRESNEPEKAGQSGLRVLKIGDSLVLWRVSYFCGCRISSAPHLEGSLTEELEPAH